MTTLQKGFIWSAIVLLSLTSIAKLLSASGDAAVMDLPDPLLGLTHKHTLIAVAAVEIAIVASLFSSMAPWRKHLLLLWLSASFLTYRIAFQLIAPGKPCPCLGSLTERLPLAPATVNLLLGCVVIYLLAGSLLALGWVPARIRHRPAGRATGSDGSASVPGPCV